MGIFLGSNLLFAWCWKKNNKENKKSSVNFLCFRFPDKEVGQYPMAYVVRKAGSNLSEGAVMNFVAGQVSWSIELSNSLLSLYSILELLLLYSQVAPYKKIRRVAFIASIPKNQSGKILRKDLVQLATSKLWIVWFSAGILRWQWTFCNAKWRFSYLKWWQFR